MIKLRSYKPHVLLLTYLFILLPTHAIAITYEEDFVTGQFYYTGTPEGDRWNTFVADVGVGAASDSYQSVTISGSNDPTGLTCTDPTIVNQLGTTLGAALGASIDISCDGNTWRVGQCGDTQALAVNMAPCSCDNPGYVIRPTLNPGNSNWGGIDTATCGGPSQSMKLDFVDGNTPPPPTGPATPIPTMSVWGLGVLIALMGIIGFNRRRKM